jgi:hypothetical protein
MENALPELLDKMTTMHGRHFTAAYWGRLLPLPLPPPSVHALTPSVKLSGGLFI